MKIRRIVANNRKQSFVIDAGKQKLSFPFSRLRLKPSRTDPIVTVYSDPEVGHEGFTYVLRSGKEETVHLDAVLDYNSDPEYIRKILLYRLTLQAQEAVADSKLSKREITRRLKTSPTQLYRLLDQTFYGKTIDQMVMLLHVLGKTVEFTLCRAA